jgi:cation diffusion facilitator CzcD-associated flavoprotein CzcO
MSVTQVDVLIVGAGISGIDAAYRLRTQAPGKTFTILEAREDLGGTWDLFRYPGIRSDSDLFTFGFPFRPWDKPNSIADGASILAYLRETVAEHGIDRFIRFGHKAVRAAWSTEDALWTVEVTHGAETSVYTCSFLYLCTGYYNYDTGHVVDFPGRAEFGGRIVHPQQWPEDLDYQDKRVVVIGSGATAVTLIPSLAERAAHVTMFQRSPSYVVSRPAKDEVADRIREKLPPKLAYRVIRSRNLVRGSLFYLYFRRFPERAAGLLRAGVAAQLGDAVAVDPHFTPAYAPWDQRLCLVPDGDLFKALKAGRASMVTDRIERFTPTGIELASGEKLEADIIVTATGLEMVSFGQIELTVDGRAVDPGQAVSYKGVMFAGIPNLAWCVGYVNLSWTLRADLVAHFVCRLLNHMDRRGYTRCVPEAGAADAGGEGRPLFGLTSGYVRRAAARLPRQGRRRPWQLGTSYFREFVSLRGGRLHDGALRFGKASPRPAAAALSAGRSRG